ncbi:hypothetical protein As57867_016103, partial [Aphanomyces stellatus]
MASHRLVWFLLVDGQGKAYNETTASSVDIPSSYVIDQFRKEVKAEYADSHLKGIAPSDLQVYANKATFDEKTILKSSAPLANLGLNEEDSLLVVVPEQITSTSTPFYASQAPTTYGIDPRDGDFRPRVGNNCKALLSFMESEMIQKDAIISSPHVLQQESLQFRLTGREEAIQSATKCYMTIIE